jgi:phosphatidate cytidylyltransferase
MLRLRVITALILAGGLVLTLAFASYPLQACIFGLVATAGAWEWATLAGAHSNWYRGAFAAGIPLLCFVLWSGVGLPDMESAAAAQPFLAASAFLWSVMLLGLKYYPAGQTIWQLVIVRAFLGLAILSSTWLAVVTCLIMSNGALVVFAMILTVAAADVGAYFVGRRFGRHALAKSISPGKTWEGFWGGLLSVVLLTTVTHQALPPAYIHLGFGSLLALGLATAGASVVGDLTVSLLKREVGVKDSGSLLPGHGGVLDRLDSICGAAPVFALGLLLVGY